MKLKGKVWKFGDDVDTDAIIPARYLSTSEPQQLAMHCFEDAVPDFSSKVAKGDIIVAGKNFGCGSSREHAPLAIKTAGISCIVAKSFARIFYRNSFNMGLPIFESFQAVDNIEYGEEIEVDAERGIIVSKKLKFTARPIPPFMQELIEAGGLMGYAAKRRNDMDRMIKDKVEGIDE